MAKIFSLSFREHFISLFRIFHLLEHSDTDISKAGRRGPMAGVGNLTGLTFTAVGCAVHLPVFFTADGVAAVPEFWRYAGVGGVAQHASQLAVFDLVADLSAKLEVIALVVY